jgi:hypothetical protein
MKYMKMAVIAMMALAFESQAEYLSVPTLATADIIISDPQSVSHTLVPERSLLAGQLKEGTPVAVGYVNIGHKEKSIVLAWTSGKSYRDNIHIIPSFENPKNTLIVSFFNPDAGPAVFVDNAINAFVLSAPEPKSDWRYVVRAARSQRVAAGTYQLAINAYLYTF